MIEIIATYQARGGKAICAAQFEANRVWRSSQEFRRGWHIVQAWFFTEIYQTTKYLIAGQPLIGLPAFFLDFSQKHYNFSKHYETKKVFITREWNSASMV